tara:strand:+ start:12979 stop:14013 length:1035 start_codon:yes stop_codon:yes gene_type:complete
LSFAKYKKRASEQIDAAYRYGNYRLYDRGRNSLNCQFICSDGLRKSCDEHFKAGHPFGPIGRPDKFPHHSGNCLYVKTDFLSEFATRTLARIDQPFVLVTGSSDFGLASRFVRTDTVEQILAHPHLTAWYAQNCDYRHPRLHPMPIGLDYHTLSSRFRYQSWGYFSTPLQQEAALNGVRLAAPDLTDKSVSAYCNWHHVLNRGDRLACINGVELEVMKLEEPAARRDRSWKNNAQHFYTLSPLGNGLDCHRTWEALLLGSVPIVGASALSGLFANLPVCVVDDWRLVTRSYLEENRQRILQSEFDFAPLYLSYWQSLFRGEETQPSRVQSFQEFIRTAHDQPMD